MENVLEINGLTKRFGAFTAVNNLSLTVKRGQVYGILGPNGSGKTTTLGMVLDVINPTEGSFKWFGSEENQRHRIGAILEHPIFYPDLSGQRNLEISAAIKKAPKENIEKVLKRVQLWERRKSTFKSFSLGMKQRLAIASALLSDPEVLVLDEPTNGLDPQGINAMRELINSIATEGKTIIISSHLLDEIQKMCSHFIILKNGTLLKEGVINDITGGKKSFIIGSKASKLEELINEMPDIASKKLLKPNEWLIAFHDDLEGDKVNEYFASKGIYLSQIQEHRTSLEEEFLQITK